MTDCQKMCKILAKVQSAENLKGKGRSVILVLRDHCLVIIPVGECRIRDFRFIVHKSLLPHTMPLHHTQKLDNDL